MRASGMRSSHRVTTHPAGANMAGTGTRSGCGMLAGLTKKILQDGLQVKSRSSPPGAWSR
ncbi:MAG: hypothetical protein QOJ99_3762 [Bryobacterales bacterium]|nr:hypothetical protein [Bryobacterales bacterium]